MRSFFIGTEGVVRGTDKKGRAATEKDPAIDNCASGSIPDFETCIVDSLRTLHGAQQTYHGTYGNGSYGTLMQLHKAGLIPEALADGIDRRYSFKVEIFAAAGDSPALFRTSAVPSTYGVTGSRSFYIATDGVIRGADHNGGPANENDPPIN